MERVALVTGSTRNAGKAIAENRSREGHHVIITSRNSYPCAIIPIDGGSNIA